MAALDRLDAESPQAYAAFRLYYELGPQRSLEEVARRMSLPVALVRQWAVRHRWDERVLEAERSAYWQILAEEMERRRRALLQMRDLIDGFRALLLGRLGDALEAQRQGVLEKIPWDLKDGILALANLEMTMNTLINSAVLTGRDEAEVVMRVRGDVESILRAYGFDPDQVRRQLAEIIHAGSSEYSLQSDLGSAGSPSGHPQDGGGSGAGAGSGDSGPSPVSE
jgi:hypothetical protein